MVRPESLEQQSSTSESQPLQVEYQLSCISDIYIMIHNSSKIIVMKQQWNNFMVGVAKHEALYLRVARGIRKAENHCSRASLGFHRP